MALYELRTYTLRVGAMAEAVNLSKRLVFQHPEGRTGQEAGGLLSGRHRDINQLVHLWKFDDDADRRAHWTRCMRTRISSKGLRPSSGRC